jgi:hypothetical protein
MVGILVRERLRIPRSAGDQLPAFVSATIALPAADPKLSPSTFSRSLSAAISASFRHPYNRCNPDRLGRDGVAAGRRGREAVQLTNCPAIEPLARSGVTGAKPQSHILRRGCLAEDAVRSETVSGKTGISLHFAICRDIFINCRESRFICCELINNVNILALVIPARGAGSIFGSCREEQRGIADLAGWAQT